jgi:hypothetical protein
MSIYYVCKWDKNDRVLELKACTSLREAKDFSVELRMKLDGVAVTITKSERYARPVVSTWVRVNETKWNKEV